MPTEEGIGRCRMGRNWRCAFLDQDPIPSSVCSAATFSLWEKESAAVHIEDLLTYMEAIGIQQSDHRLPTAHCRLPQRAQT